MSALSRAHNRRTADGPAPACAGAGQIDGPGVYLTNEVFLYRVVRFVESTAGEMVELEDCYWLDIVRVPVSEVHARGLRVVTAGPVSG